MIADAERTHPLVEVSRRRRLLAATAAILLVVAQVPLVLLQARDEPLWFYRPMLTISDIALAPLIVLAAPDVLARARVRTLGAGVTVGAALLAALAVSWLVHPSLQGALILYRLSGALVLATVLADRSTRLALAIPFAATAAIQAALAAAQSLNGGTLGLPIEEYRAEVVIPGRPQRVSGTLLHPYLLAGAAFVAGATIAARLFAARRAVRWLPLLAAAFVPLGLTFSRAALGGVALGAFVLGRQAIGGSLRHRLTLVALLVGFGVPALLAIDGWTTRTESSLLNGRELILGGALRELAADPLFGTGPGRLVPVLRERQRREPGSDEFVQAVHDVPLQLAVEGGVVAGGLAAALVGVLAIRAFRSPPPALFVFVSMLPFVLVDDFLVTQPQGLVLFGVWLGLLDGLATEPA